MPKHFMRIRDLGHSGAWEIIRRAKEMKETNYRGHCMDGKVAALIFEKASTRTRVSFDVAVRQLGGTTIFMTPAESQLGRSEPLRDTARVLSRYVDCLIVRTFGQEKLDELAEYGSLPVVNALTDQGHPCQLMADLLTIYERTPDFSKVTVAWVGDGNNMANSWIEAAMYFPFQLNMAIAPGYEPDQQLLSLALQSGAKIFLTHDPKLAVDGANYIYADVWASMGQESEQKKREEAFKGFCVDSELMSLAAPGVKFLHCLPPLSGMKRKTACTPRKPSSNGFSPTRSLRSGPNSGPERSARKSLTSSLSGRMVSNQPFSGVPAQTCSPPDKRRIHGIALPFPRRTGPSRTSDARLPSGLQSASRRQHRRRRPSAGTGPFVARRDRGPHQAEGIRDPSLHRLRLLLLTSGALRL